MSGSPVKEREEESRSNDKIDREERRSSRERERHKKRRSGSRERSKGRDRDRDRERGHKGSRRSRSREKDRKKKSREKEQKKSRSRSRSRKKDKREKKGSMWDQAPPEGTTNVAFSLALGVPLVQSGLTQALAARPVHPKKARTVFVGGLTPALTAEVLRDFFEAELPKIPDRPKTSGPAVDTVDVKMDKKYAFVEFHNSVDADIAMCMDGCKVMGNQIGIRRPTNYVPPQGPQKQWKVKGVLSTNVEDGPGKIFLGNLPLTMTENEVQMLAEAFGELSAFILSRDNATGLSKGYAFFAYSDESRTQMAITGLHGQEINGKKIACKLADNKAGNFDIAALTAGVPVAPNPVLASLQLQRMMLPMQTHILVMSDMVTPEELNDDQEYSEIVEDITEEMGRHGQVQKVIIPRPVNGNLGPEVGKIFVKYTSVDAASRAIQALNGRRFNERIISISYINEDQWNNIAHLGSH